MPFLAPAFLLLGSLVLALWRPAERRGPWLIEAAAGTAALATIVGLHGAIPWRAVIPLWTDGLLARGEMVFALTEPSWTMLTAGLSLIVIGSLQRRMAPAASPSESGTVWLLPASAAVLAILAANLLTVAVTWAVVGLTEAFFRRPTEGERPAGAGISVGPSDVVPIALLLGAAAAPGSPGIATGLALGAAAARTIRLWSSAGGLHSGAAAGFLRTCLMMTVVMSMLGTVLDGIPSGEVGTAAVLLGGAMLVGGAASLAVMPGPESGGVAWISTAAGAGLLAGGLEPAGMAWALSAAAAMLAAGSVMLAGSVRPGPIGRVAAAFGAAAMLGLPLTSGGLIAAQLRTGLLAGWIGILGLAVAGARFIEALLDRRPGSGASPAGWTTAAGVAWMAVLSGWVYLRNLPVEGAAAVAIGLAVVVSVGVTAGLSALGPGRRSRLARALRVPNLQRVRQGAAAGAGYLQAGVRVGRDILEGDAAVLWAFVALLAVLLGLRSTG